MLSKIRYIFIFIISYSVNITSAMETSSTEELPRGYMQRHKNVAEQIKCYRELYKAVLDESGLEVMKSGPIKGLEQIARNAFALTYDVIDQAKDNQSPDLKDYYLQILQDLWNKFPKEQAALTSKDFQLLNLQLSYIVENYNNKVKLNIHVLDNLLDLQVNHKLNNNFSFYPDIYHEPIFIIYANPQAVNTNKRGITTTRFVDEYFHQDFPAYLALFDVLSKKPSKPTKKDVHYSFINGPHNLLVHDISAHITKQIIFAHPENMKYWYLKRIYDIAQKLKENNDINKYNILMYGLFLITHERPQIIDNNVYIKEGKFNKDDYKIIITSISPNFFQNLKKVKFEYMNKTTYNIEFQSWEMYLKNTNDDEGNSFFDRDRISYKYKIDGGNVYLSDDYKNELLLGYQNFWDKFKQIVFENDEWFK